MKFDVQAILAKAAGLATSIQGMAQLAEKLPGGAGAAALVVDKVAGAVKALGEEAQKAIDEHDATSKAATLDELAGIQAQVDAEVDTIAAQVAAR